MLTPSSGKAGGSSSTSVRRSSGCCEARRRLPKPPGEECPTRCTGPARSARTNSAKSSTKLRPDEPITLDTFVDDLAEFVRALRAGPVHLVGHSSPGGFGSLRLASQHPELLRTLVLLEPPAFPLLGVSIPPRPAQVIKLLIRHPRAGIGFIKFGAKGMGPAIKAFERGDDSGALRIFMAANTSEAVVESLPEAMFQRFV